MAMKFEILYAEQRSKEWFDIRLGKPSASRLGDWLAVSKAAKTLGEPLKVRTEYELELSFEASFRKSFQKPVTREMRLGTELEPVVRKKYEEHTGRAVEEIGCYYNKYFVASPDGLVGKDGTIEIKVLGDKSFVSTFDNGIAKGYMLQIQGNLLASGRKWCDFVAYNINSDRLYIKRVERDEDAIKMIEDSLKTFTPTILDTKQFIKAGIDFNMDFNMDNIMTDNEEDIVWS